VRFQQVVIDEDWRRSGDMVVSSGHVNLSVRRRAHGSSGSGSGSGSSAIMPDQAIIIDFLPGEAVQGYRSYQLEEATILAMFANNRAVEALLQERIAEGYWWARAALLRDPGFVPAYNTLAVIHQRHGEALLAERSWRMALQREPENVVAMRNLAPLLASQGRQTEADALLQRAAAIEPYPPFYFFERGMAALERKDHALARSMFAREVARAPYHDEFHFWLGIALLRLGQRDDARDEIMLAAQTSTSPDTGRLYAAKLDLLRKGAPRPGQ
jgi:Tfp pilus assembly protein PilF